MNTSYRSLLGFSLVCIAAAWAAPARSTTSAPATATAVAPMTASQAAAAKAANVKAQAENDLIAIASGAESKSDWAGAEAALKQLITMDPGRWDFSQSLANDQFNAGKYSDAVKSYDSAIQGASADTADPSARQALATLYTNQANAYLKLKNNTAATADFAKAAALGGGPDAAASFYNLCATAYNAHKDKEALADCDKAIAADPKMAEAWFVKGSILVGEGETDAKGNFNVPPGTLEALQAYLKLEPHGKHASEVKAMLQLATP